MSSERRLLFLFPESLCNFIHGLESWQIYFLEFHHPHRPGMNFITLELWLLQYCCRVSKSAWSINDKTCFTRCLNTNHSLALLWLLLYFSRKCFLGCSWGGFCQQVQCISFFLAWFVYECVIWSETRIWEIIRDYKAASLIGFKSRAFSSIATW